LRQRRRPAVRRPPLPPRALLDEGGDRRLEIRVEIGLRHGAPRNDIHALKRKERLGGDERAGKARACRRHRDCNLRKYVPAGVPTASDAVAGVTVAAVAMTPSAGRMVPQSS